MLKQTLIFLSCFFIGFLGFSQNRPTIQQFKKIKISDSIIIDTLSIQPEKFKLRYFNKKDVDSSFYRVDYAKAKLYLKATQFNVDSLTVSYLRYPDFLTKKYQLLNPNLIVPKNTQALRFYKLTQSNVKKTATLFNGLSTSGSISRGITIGNNQNSVFNSELDLQLSGKLSDDVTLRASLQDSNIPIQQGGYSQSIDEFDQIFIELQAKNWGVRAGDIQLSEQESIFATFTKKLQGLSTNATINGAESKTNIYASGALVRGIFNQSIFQGQEGNQGPYKLIGQNGELLVLIVSGSETVYVNGLALNRGENNDYIIDYNAGEIRFNPTYPITADMRINIEYQTTQSNFARIFGYGGATYTSDKLNLQGFVYTENDIRNQTLQQALSNEQKLVLSLAGDDPQKAISPSAVLDTFSENKTLYKNIGTTEAPIYEFTNTEEDREGELFNVRFSQVPQGTGNYTLANADVANRIFEYITPINGISQGNFDPVIQLIAPNKLQLAVVKGSYQPIKETILNFELAGSNNDSNLFSDSNDSDNEGGAIHVDFLQQLFNPKEKSWKITLNSGIDYVDAKFKNIERLYNIEFNRDWNLDFKFKPNNQVLSKNTLQFTNLKRGTISYGLEYLDFRNQYKGIRHLFNTNLTHKRWRWNQNFSFLNSDALALTSSFLRNATNLSYTTKKTWSGFKFLAEANKESNKKTKVLTPISQRFQSYEVYTGIGDSTTVFAKLGYRFRENDSIQNNRLQKVAASNTIYLDSKIINNEKSQLSLFINYRELKDIRETEKDKNLNSRLIYRQRLWKNRVQWNTLIETQSGTLPQQEFTYAEVDAGQGQYTWIDYNNDSIQDLQEFELSPFMDQATYIRVLLPRQRFIKTYQNKLSQQLNWNFSSFQSSKSKWKKWISHFFNQTSYVIDRSVRRENNNLKLNVFENSNNDLGLNLNLRNALFFNRGKQNYSTTYTHLNTQAKNIFITGSQQNKLKSNRLNFAHKIKESWLFDMQYENSLNKSIVENTPNRNFTIKQNAVTPKVSYLLSNQSSISLAYEVSQKKNILIGNENLSQQRFTASFRFANKQDATFTGAFDWFENEFEGNAFSPVSFQILEGLEPGRNFTWNVLAQKKITKFLELNINYNGRKSENSKTIHTGNVQLRAFF